MLVIFLVFVALMAGGVLLFFAYMFSKSEAKKEKENKAHQRGIDCQATDKREKWPLLHWVRRRNIKKTVAQGKS